MKRILQFIGMFTAVLVILAASALAETIVLQPSPKDLGVGAKCSADYAGQLGSADRGASFRMSMASSFCWHIDGMVQFDLSQLQGISPGDITSAELKIYQAGNNRWDKPFNVSAYPNVGDWDEATVWHYNMPGYDATSFAENQVQINKGTGWVSWSITDIVQAWQSGQLENYGVRLLVHQGSGADSSATYYSGEYTGNASLTPQLAVEYNAGEPIPTLTEWAIIALVGGMAFVGFYLLKRRGEAYA